MIISIPTSFSVPTASEAYTTAWRAVAQSYQADLKTWNTAKSAIKYWVAQDLQSWNEIKPMLATLAWFISSTVGGAFDLVFQAIMSVEFQPTEIPDFEEDKFIYVGDIDLTADEIPTVTAAMIENFVAFVSSAVETVCQPPAIEIDETGIVSAQLQSLPLADMKDFARFLGAKIHHNLGKAKTSAILHSYYGVEAI